MRRTWPEGEWRQLCARNAHDGLTYNLKFSDLLAALQELDETRAELRRERSITDRLLALQTEVEEWVRNR